MKNTFLKLLFTGMVLASCQQASETIETTSQEENRSSDRSVQPQTELITTKNQGGWGYQVLREGKLIIDQQTIPAIQGNKYFVSDEEAKMVGELALKKIEKNIFPPTISIEELDSLKITY